MSTATALIESPSVHSQLADHLWKAIERSPNNAALVTGLQQLMAESGGAPSVRRVLYEWHLRPDLTAAMRGLLAMMQVFYLRQDAAGLDPRMLAVDPTHPSFKAIYRSLALDLNMIVARVELLTQIQSGQLTLENSPKFMIAMMKSGSSLLGFCLSEMVKLARTGRLDETLGEWRGYPTWWNFDLGLDWDLRPEIGADFLFKQCPGSVYKGHIPPTPKNLVILNRIYFQSRYVVVVRDPRDQIVARYCHHLRSNLASGDGPTSSERDVHSHLHDYMESGELLETLHFIGKWLTIRNVNRSMVVTYEQLMNQPLQTLRAMAGLYELVLSDAQMSEIYGRSDRFTNRVRGQDQSGHDRSIYPLGWTGEIGVWRKYFDRRNTSTFQRIFNAFATSCPWAVQLAQLYPELSSAA